MRLLVVVILLALAASPALAKRSKVCHPDLNSTVLSMQADLQRSGWWQVVPVGQNPNDATYVEFLLDTFAALGNRGLNGNQIEKLIAQVQNGGCE